MLPPLDVLPPVHYISSCKEKGKAPTKRAADQDPQARPEGAPPLPKVPSHTRDTRKASLRTSPEDHRIESLSRGNLPHRIGEQRQLKATPKHASRDSPSDYGDHS